MSEFGPGPEEEPRPVEPTASDVSEALKKVLSGEALEYLGSVNDIGEALGIVYAELLGQGMEPGDIDNLLRAHGLIE